MTLARRAVSPQRRAVQFRLGAAPVANIIAFLRIIDYLNGMSRTATKKTVTKNTGTKKFGAKVLKSGPGHDPMIAASEKAATLLKAMASPVRLRILCLLAEGEMPVGEIAGLLNIREQATSQQLAQLRLEGLIAPRRNAQRIFYSLASAEIELILGTLREIYCPR